jgi:hypothetical protein
VVNDLHAATWDGMDLALVLGMKYNNQPTEVIMKSLFVGVLLAAFAPVYCLAQEQDQDQTLIVQEVRCQGNTSTNCEFISGHLYLSNGDALNEREVQNARLRLSSLSNFKSVDIHLEKGATKGRAVIVIEVAEASPITKEILIGTSSKFSRLSQKMTARMSHQNLFGSGKILDVQAGARLPLDKADGRDLGTRLQYVDPNLLGSNKYFMISGLSYENTHYDYKFGNYYESEQFGADLSLGRRLFNFSYVTAGFQYHPYSKVTNRFTYSDGTTEKTYSSKDRVYSLGYGWNSEDDAYFPTQGSRFHTSLAWTFGSQTWLNVGVGWRQTWSTANNSIWTLKIGATPGTEYRPSLEEDLGITMAYARPIGPTERFGGIERGRWFIEPGFNSLGYSTYTGTIVQPGVKAGVRLESKHLGIVDLYVLAATEWKLGGKK